MRTAKILSIVALAAISFMLGAWWHKHELIESGPLQLTEPMLLSGRHGEPGTLPAGTVLYPYSVGPSINTYLTFINTKHTPSLEPVTFDRYLTIAPIEAYPDPETP